MRSNRQLILYCALELFNERGSYKVTTNRICEVAGISPGNLYYHFKNKEEIIYELFVQMIGEWEADDYQIDQITLSDEVMLHMLAKTGEFFWRYRFIHKELMFLAENDPRLKERNDAIQAKRLEQLHAMVENNISKAVLRPMTPPEKDFLVDSLWMGSLFWQPYLEVSGQANNQENIEKISHHFLTMIHLFKN